MAFASGNIVKNVQTVYGRVVAYDPSRHPTDPRSQGIDGPPGAGINELVDIPPGHTGEVLDSDEHFTTVIYPIHNTGKLQPMLIKVEDFTSVFKRVVRHNPFIWDKDRDLKNPGRPVAKEAAPKYKHDKDPNQDWNPQSHFGDSWNPEETRAFRPEENVDPLDLKGAWAVVQEQEVPWWKLSRPERERAVANALRVGILSPMKLLKFNAVHFQDISHIPGDETDIQVYLDALAQARERWNVRGQADLFSDPGEVDPFDPNNAERYAGYIHKHLAYVTNVAANIKTLTDAAELDMSSGGEGYVWRHTLNQLNLQGVNNKVASFAWLLLAPTTSQLATIDTHMNKSLGVDQAYSSNHYHQLEREMHAAKDALGYTELPLGAFQWAMWDYLRTPPDQNGYHHQSHGAMKVLDPVPYTEIKWHSPQSGKFGMPAWWQKTEDVRRRLREEYEAKDVVERSQAPKVKERQEPQLRMFNKWRKK